MSKIRFFAIMLDVIALTCAIYLVMANASHIPDIALPDKVFASALLPGDLMLAFSHPFFMASMAASAATFYVSALYFTGTYDAAELVQPSRSFIRIFGLWLLCLVMAVVIAGVDVMAALNFLRPVDACVPFTVLASRATTLMLVNWSGYDERLRSENELSVVENKNLEHCQISTSRDHGLTLYVPSFANIPKASLDLLVEVAANRRRSRIVLVQGGSAVADCMSFAEALGMTDMQVVLLSVKVQTDISTCQIQRTDAGFFYELQKAPLPEKGQRAKRAMDLALAAGLCVIMAPLLLLIAVAVKVTSKGPVLYAQTRTGRNGRTFTILKFRTMTVQESGDSVVQAVRGDKRVTFVGRLLRCTSLDELPQLLNVLKGEMSLIGPRPHAVAHDRAFLAEIPHYGRRFRVRPGISGLAQVHGYRGETRTEDAIINRVALDLAYIDTWSFRGDLSILIHTLLAVLFPRNAY